MMSHGVAANTNSKGNTRMKTDNQSATAHDVGSGDLFGLPSDTDMLNWLAQRCYLPGDHPDDGILVVVSTEFSPLGEFTCNEENDNAALRRAIARAMRGPNDQALP